MAFGQITKASCAPLLGYAHVQADRASHWQQCITFQDRAFAYVARHPEVATVVLAGYWSDDLTLRAATPAGNSIATEGLLTAALANTIARLQGLGKQVIVVQDIPTFSFDPYGRAVGNALPLRRLASLALAPRWPDQSSAPLGEVNPDHARSIVATAAHARKAMLIDPMRTLCTAIACRYRDNASIYYFDFQHLTRTGAIAALRGTAFEVGRHG
jgi:hypothetical protein